MNAKVCWTRWRRFPDPRDPRGIRYPLSAVLAVAVCAVMGGASSFAAITDWLHDLDEHGRGRLGFGDTVPVVTTMWRLLTRLDPSLLASVLAGWLHTRTRPPAPSRRYRRVIAVDGKPCQAPASDPPSLISLGLVARGRDRADQTTNLGLFHSCMLSPAACRRCPVGRVEPDLAATELSFEHHDLVPQHQDLGVLVAVAHRQQPQ